MVSQGDVYMRMRQNKDRIIFFSFVEHGDKKVSKSEAPVKGWYIKTQAINSKRSEGGFIKDDELTGFISKTRYVKLDAGDIARRVLTGEIDANFIQTV